MCTVVTERHHKYGLQPVASLRVILCASLGRENVVKRGRLELSISYSYLPCGCILARLFSVWTKSTMDIFLEGVHSLLLQTQLDVCSRLPH